MANAHSAVHPLLRPYLWAATADIDAVYGGDRARPALELTKI